MKRERLTEGTKEHLFKKGGQKPPGSGRVKGQPNKVTTELKVAIITAAAMVGSDNRGKDGLEGYLARVAWKHPDVFERLLRKLLPYQLTGKDGGPMKFEATTKEQIIDKFKERGLPLPPSLMDQEPPSQARN